MAVYVQSKSGGSVTEIILNCLDVITGSDRSNGIGVPEIMEPSFWTSNFLHDSFEGFVDGGSKQVVA